MQGLGGLPSDLPGPEAAVVRTASALSVRRAPAAGDVAVVAAAAIEPANRPRLRAAAALVYVAADMTPDAGPDHPHHPTVDDAAALVDALPADRASFAILATGRAMAALRGDAPTAEILSTLRATAAAGAAVGSRRLSDPVVGHLALLEACEGRLNRAAQLAGEAEAVEVTRGTAETDRSATVAAALAWVALDRWEVDAARDWLARARERSARGEFRLIGPVLATLQSRLLRLRHEHDLAEATLRDHLDDRRLPRWVQELVVTEAVQSQFARGRIDDGLSILDRSGDGTRWDAVLRATACVLGGPDADPPADSGDRTPPVLLVESAVLRACRDLQDGTVPGAVTELLGALDVAARETLRWPFFDAPAPARRLLRMHPRVAGRDRVAQPLLGPRRGPASAGSGCPGGDRRRASGHPGPQPAGARGPRAARGDALDRGDRGDDVHLGEHRPHPYPQHPAEARSDAPQPGRPASPGARHHLSCRLHAHAVRMMPRDGPLPDPAGIRARVSTSRCPHPGPAGGAARPEGHDHDQHVTGDVALGAR